MLEIAGLFKTFARGTPRESCALAGIDLSVEAGSFVLITGTRGSGRSALIEAVAGVFPPDEGTVTIDSRDVTALPEHRRAALVGRVGMDPLAGTADNLTVLENLALAANRSGRAHPLAPTPPRNQASALAQDAAGTGFGLEDALDRPAATLTAGQRQALALRMAACSWAQPKVLLLDRPTIDLERRDAERFLRLVRETVEGQKLTTLMVTESVNEAATLGDRLLMLHKGEIVYDVSGSEKRRLRTEELQARFEEARRSEQLDRSAAELLRAAYV